VKYLSILLTLVLSGCIGVQTTNSCPGERIGTLECSGGLCKQSYAGEVFYQIVGEPANVAELLSLVHVAQFNRKLWYASNTGKFKLYVGGPNNGYAYQFSKGPTAWVATLEPDAYACTS
jgi:hypothetical protein